MARALGIDYGERRVGLALSDPLGMIASPLPTLKRRKGKRAPVAPVARIVEENEVTELVVGLPLGLDGEENDWTREVRSFGDALAERTGLPVTYQDERMTSVRAERAVRSLGLSKKQREEKERVDAAAAVLILQAYLDTKQSS
ncbi:MAG TPA: Holliday junction resolvase RuvX [Longimicrobiales bacterium]|nr:Holliday junction resolvase RuvX [Longimicrobiales bacterium]